ncbi:MAG TPA: hypothetical protein VGY32_12255, partial [Solirubrobacteraceae bacterium]|nr:hypothetical protein [Solirubrobacteraceae bacterium]
MEPILPGAENSPGSAGPVGNGRVEVGDDGSGVEPVSQSAAEQMTIAGAAWKKLGEEATLVVLGR